MPKVPGPVRSLVYLDTYRLLILGEVYDIGDTERSLGYDYINIVDTRDGYTDRQFEAIKPNDIVQVVRLGPKSVIVSADPAGIVRWNASDAYGLDWTDRGIVPMYMSAGLEGRALLVGKDGLSITLLDTEDGASVASGRLAQKATGGPRYMFGVFVVPTEGGVEILGQDARLVESINIEGFGGKAGVLGTADGFYFVGGNMVAKFGF